MKKKKDTKAVDVIDAIARIRLAISKLDNALGDQLEFSSEGQRGYLKDKAELLKKQAAEFIGRIKFVSRKVR